MDTKRLLLAIALSMLAVSGWQLLSVKMGWVQPPVTQNATVQTAVTEKPAQSAPSVAGEDLLGVTTPGSASTLSVEDTLITVETPLYKAILHSNGGTMQAFQLKTYFQNQRNGAYINLISQNAAGQGAFGLNINGISTWTVPDWTYEGGDLQLNGAESGKLRFVGVVDGIRVVRELEFSADTYLIKEKLSLESPVAKSINFGYLLSASPLAIADKPSILSSLRYLILGGEEPALEENQYNYTRAAWLHNQSLSEENSSSKLAKEPKVVLNNISWAGIMNNYFLGAASVNHANASMKATFANNVYQVFLITRDIGLTPQQESSFETTYFFGPKLSSLLKTAPNGIDKALDYGVFTVIAKPLVSLLQFFYSYVHNYGVAIILMTLVIKILFWPLSQKSYKSMNIMRKLQPEMTKIREKYADDKKKMNEEIMQLYKTYKVNPASGCLPIALQIPVFFALYQALLNSIELRHAAFIQFLPFTDKPWLSDLAAPDPYMITPLIMGASMFFQQKMSPPAGDPTQQKILLAMPIIFTVIFINFSSGLVLYWLVNNIISMIQQMLTRRAQDS